MVLEFSGERVEVVAGDEAEHAIVGEQELTRLLLGSEDPILVLEEGLRCRGRGDELAHALFPKQEPVMHNKNS